MKVGFVALIGRPNVGKSTLLNKILDYDVSITSDRPQTTRDKIKGIYNDDESQIIFVDTPGIHKPKQKIGESLNNVSYETIQDVELILFLQPADEAIGPGDKRIIETIKTNNKAALITKIDKTNPKDIQTKVQKLKHLGFDEVLGTSIEIDASIKSLMSFIKNKLKEGMPFYETDVITDKSMRFIAKEIIRESAINLTYNEIPHSIGVFIEEFHEPKQVKEQIIIVANIIVERESQKGILVGKKGSMIKKIGKIARKKISFIFDNRVHLDLRIKVNKNWTNKQKEIIKMGY